MSVKLIHGDCLVKMKRIPDKSVDMILCDLPYGTTACKWDVVIPFDKLWEQYNRIIKDGGAIVLFSSQPFTSALIMSNPNKFKHDWIWVKDKPSNFATAKYAPMKYHEHINVFCNCSPTYNKQMIPRTGSGAKRYKTPVVYKAGVAGGDHIKTTKDLTVWYDPNLKNPSTILKFSTGRRQDYVHPTQKPVALLEYFIKTYTNVGEIILDNCMGSGSTGVAAINLDRGFIGIELDAKYFEIAKKRITDFLG